MLTFKTVEALVRGVLEDALAEANEAKDLSAEEPSGRWTLQGFGMLRRYFPGDWRLNVWDSRLRVLNVSLVHDHPWHFESLVLSGGLRNVRFLEFLPTDSLLEAIKGDRRLHRWSRLKPGAGGGLLADGGAVVLVEKVSEAYGPGFAYSQQRDEIHLSDPTDGCVTLNRRFDRLEADVARVFWPDGTEWVSAEPRPATAGELKSALEVALTGWGTVP